MRNSISSGECSAPSRLRPTTSSAFIARLALLVWLAVRGRCDSSADRTRDHDDRQHVRKHAEDLVGEVHTRDLQAAAESVGAGEQERSAEGADRGPPAEDHRGEGDETAAAGHVREEVADLLEREVRAAEAGERAAEDDIGVAHEVDVDAGRLGSQRVLAAGARAKAEHRVEQYEVD